MSRSISKGIVKGRWIIMILFIGLMIFSLWSMDKVNVNYNLAQYLPSESSTTVALDIIQEEFGLSGQAEVMIKDIHIDEAILLRGRLAEIEYVERVTFMNNEIYFQDTYGDGFGYALYKIIIVGDDYSKNAESVIDSLSEHLKQYEIVLNGQSAKNLELKERISNEMIYMVFLSIIIVAVILLLTSHSWMEPVIFGIIIGIAILINMGTNYFLGEISYIVKSIAAIMQMALSMDYALVTMHNYNSERKKGYTPKNAMIEGLAKSLSPVSASSITTMCGLGAIMFMSYKIGLDIGLVLVKAIFISMMTVFLVMPGLIVILNKPIESMRHERIRFFDNKPKNTNKTMNYVRFLNKYKKAIPAIMILIVLTSYILQNNLTFEFSEGHKNRQSNEVVEIFGESNQVYMIVPKATEENGGYNKQREMIERLSRYKNEDGENILKDTLSYVTTVTLRVDAKTASHLMNIDLGIINQIFGTYYLENGMIKDDKIRLDYFVDFAVELLDGDRNISESVEISEMLGVEMSGYIKAFQLILNSINNNMTADQMTQFLLSMSNYGIKLDLTAREISEGATININSFTIINNGVVYTFKDGIIIDSNKTIVGYIDTDSRKFTLKGVNYEYDDNYVYQTNVVLGDYISQIYGMMYYKEYPQEAPAMTLIELINYLDGLSSGRIESGIDINIALDNQLKGHISSLSTLLNNMDYQMNADRLFNVLLSVADLAGFEDFNESYKSYIYFIYGNYFMQDPLYKGYEINLGELIRYIDSIANPKGDEGSVFPIDKILGDGVKEKIAILSELFQAMEKKNTASYLTQVLNGLSIMLPNIHLDEIYIAQLYGNYYFDTTGKELGLMTIEEFILFADYITSDERWAPIIEEELAQQISGLKYIMLDAMADIMTAPEFFALINDPRVVSLAGDMSLSQSHIDLIYTLFMEYYNGYIAYVFQADIRGEFIESDVLILESLMYHLHNDRMYINDGVANLTSSGIKTIEENLYYYDLTELYPIVGSRPDDYTLNINGSTYTIEGTEISDEGGVIGSIEGNTIRIGQGANEKVYSIYNGVYVYQSIGLYTPSSQPATMNINNVEYLMKKNNLYLIKGYVNNAKQTMRLLDDYYQVYSYNSMGDIYRVTYDNLEEHYAIIDGTIYYNDLEMVDCNHDIIGKSFAIDDGFTRHVYYYRSQNISDIKTGEGIYLDWDFTETINDLYLSTAEFIRFASKVGPDLLNIESDYWNAVALMGSEDEYYNYVEMTAYINRIFILGNMQFNEETIYLLYKMYYFVENPTENYDPETEQLYDILRHGMYSKDIIGSEVLLFSAKLLNSDENIECYYDKDIYNDQLATMVEDDLVNSLINVHRIFVIIGEDEEDYTYQEITEMLNQWLLDFAMSGIISTEYLRQLFIMRDIELGTGNIYSDYDILGEDLVQYLIALLDDNSCGLQKILIDMINGFNLTQAQVIDLLNVMIDKETTRDYSKLNEFLSNYYSFVEFEAGNMLDILKQGYILYNIDNHKIPKFAKSAVSGVDLINYMKALTMSNNDLYSDLITEIIKDYIVEIYDGLNILLNLNNNSNTPLKSNDMCGYINNLLENLDLEGYLKTEELNLLYTLYSVQNNLKPFTTSKDAIKYTMGETLEFTQALLSKSTVNSGYNGLIADFISELFVVRDPTETDDKYDEKKAAALEDIVFALDTLQTVHLQHKSGVGFNYIEVTDLVNNSIKAILSDNLVRVVGGRELPEIVINPYMIEQVFVKYFADNSKLPSNKLEVKTLVEFLNESIESNSVIKDLMTENQKEILTSYNKQLEDGAKMFDGEDYSRIIFVLNIKDGSKEAFDFVDVIRSNASIVYGDHATYLAGNTPGLRDVSGHFNIDIVVISIISAIAIMIIIMLIYRSLAIPLILVLVIQSAIWISFSLNVLVGKDMFFLAYIIVTCIQMGATIDYGIILSSNYIEQRKVLPKLEALSNTLKKSLAPILTSGIVIAIASFTISSVSTSIAVSTIGSLLGRGAMISMFLILFVLPAVLLISDKAIDKTTIGTKFYIEKPSMDQLED